MNSMRQSDQDPPEPASGPRVRWRRLLRWTLVVGLLAWLGHGALIDVLAGHSGRRSLVGQALSPAASDLLVRCLEDLPPGPLVDLHAHLAGRGPDSGCWVNPRLLSPLHPLDWVRMRFYLSGAGLDSESPDAAWIEGLAGLARARQRPALHFLLAFDHRYSPQGVRDLDHSEFYVPNDYAHAAAEAHSDVFRCAISVHPYRPDAVQELERWAARGVRLVKWLPGAQGMDPASPLCDAFYRALAAQGMVLLVHCGEEQAVDAETDQELGNPLRLRRPLEAGVQILVAHCASSGTSLDLDVGGPNPPRVGCFELFLRLMGEEAFEGQLWGEISTVTQVNRYSNALAVLLEREDLHPRLVNGSDWPLPALNVLYQTRALASAGFITAEEREALNEIYHHNPLTFDLALKRVVRSPETGARFAPEIFTRLGPLR
ncbi:MAG: amidohydrolase family protein [Planctomycetota bacterium]|nr:amidohydrolase family protein [Planctomycetota bacterium]